MTHITTTIRAESDVDHPAIHRLVAAVFPTSAEAELIDDLRRNGRLTISLVALDGACVVGHVAFSPVTLDGRPLGLGLAPSAVLPEFQRRGIGAELVRAGLEECRRRQVGVVVLLGSPAYYGRFGLKPAAIWNLRDEYHGGDAFQAIELRPQAIPASGGLVQYAAEFSRFG